MMYRVLVAFALAALALAPAGCSESNKPYPNRPVHLVVGFGVGAPDATARILAAQLTQQTGQRFLVDNKPGSSGEIGAEFVAEAKPDGYTLLIAPASLESLPNLQRNLPFDLRRSFVPITQIAESDASFLIVPPSLPVKTLKDFVAYARDPSHHTTYASTGIGTGSHLRFALFSQANHLSITHVPFKSPGDVAVSIMGGQTQASFLTVTQAMPLIKAGKVRALAYDFPTRNPDLPDVPTMTEGGAAPTDLDPGFHGLFAPAGTPPQVVAYLETQLRKAVATPDVQKRLTTLGMKPVGSSSADFAKVIDKTLADMNKAAHAAGIKPQ
jgi:tripartite-type tricarboxylate transporter receptor subunit TctC